MLTNGKMTLDEILPFLSLENKKIEVTLIKAATKGREEFTKGRLTGFKSGLYGRGHHNYKRDKEGFDFGSKTKSIPFSFSSNRMRWIKRSKVHVTYYVFEFGDSEYSDWVDVDNVTFEIIDLKQQPTI